MKMFKLLFASIAALFLCAIAAAMPPATPQNLRPAWLHTYTAPAEAFTIWEAVPGAESYNVYRSDDANTNWTLIASNLTVSYYSDPFSLFLPSYYTVTAVNGDGESSGAEPVSVFEAWCGSIMVTYISPWNGNVSATNAIVEWVNSHPLGEEGLVEWGPAQGGPNNYTAYAINTNYLPWHRFNLTNLTPLTLYQYRITSINPQRGGLRSTNFFTTTDTNHAPVLQYYVMNFQPDTSGGFSIMYWATDVDFPPQNITFQLTQPTNGSIAGPWEAWTLEGIRWSLWYVPHVGARGPDQITATASDGVDTVTAVIQFTNWMNTVPAAGWVTTNIIEDTPTLITLPNYDAEGDPLTYEIFMPYGGTVSGTPPNVTFHPDPNRTGEASMSYWIMDPYSTNWGWVSINITPVNDRPTAYPSSFTTWEEQTVTTWLNWSDVEYGVPMTAVIVRPPAHGTVTGEIWQMQYTPETNFYGEDSFDFVIREEDGTTSDPATITIQVNGLNDPPNVPAETFYTREDTAVSFTVGATDPEGNPLTYWINSGPNHGTLTGTLPNLTYTPEPGYFGPDTFNYSATDGFESRPNNVTIGVGVNSLPQPTLRRNIFEDGIVRLTWNDLGAQHYNVYRADGTNAPFTLLASNVVATNFNDETAQWQQPYWYRVRSWDGTNEGQPSLAKFAYPDATGLLNLNQMNWVFGGTTGRVSFYYSLESGIEALFEYGTNRNYGITLENTNLLPAQVFGLTGLTPGTVYYFRITTTDAKGNSLVASTNMLQDWFTTQPRPIANSQSISLAEDTSGAVTPSGSDANWRPLTFSLVSNPAHGTVSIVTVTGGYYYFYVPAPNYFGSDTFTYKANNGELDSLPATVSITVTPVNDAPVASNQSIVMAEDTSRNLVLTGTDVEGGALTYQIIQSPTNGTFIAGTPPNLTYRPATNYFGTDSFKFTVRDSQFATATGTVSITITNINDRPIALAQSLTTPEDASLVVGASGIDPDGDVLQLMIQTLPTNGTLSLYTTQTVLYTPNPNFSGADGFQVRVYDGKLMSLVNVPVNITVTPVNDRPTANPQSVLTPEDTARAITLTGSDVEGSPLTYQITSGPTHGTLSGSGATRTYTPHANYVGSDQFNFVANDGTSNSAPATISLTIAGSNDAPAVTNQSITISEDGVAVIVPLASDPDGDAITFVVVTAPLNGTAAFNGSNFVYAPFANYNGTDSFDYAASDIFGGTTTGTVSITVSAVNDAPGAANQSVSTAEDTPVNIALAATDVEGSSLVLRILNQPTNGVLSGTIPNLIYTPNANFNGTDAFTFTANDGDADGNTATVTISVTAVNDPPLAYAQSVTVTEDQSVAFTLNASDPEGSSLYYMVPGYPAHGSLSGIQANRIYTPVPNYFGTDTITFRVFDGVNYSAEATVTITITPVPDAPVVSSRNLSTPEDTALAITLPAIDRDLDPLTISIVGEPSHGVVSGTGWNVIYTPNPDFNGTDSFTFQANDGTFDSNIGTISINVTAVADAPAANAQTVTTAEDTAANITLTGSDPDGDTLSYSILSAPTNGTLNGSGATITYTPNANYHGTDSFTFVSNDGTTNSNPATVNLTVTPLNDAPVAVPQNQSLAEDESLAITLAGSDVDDDALNFSVVTPPAHGALSGTGANVTYTPEPNYNGADSFTFVANDGVTNSAPATVSLTVTTVNDAPVAASQIQSLPEDGSLAITLVGSDIDGDALGFSVVTPPTHGALSGTGANLTYTPEPNYNGADSFTFVANDGTTNSAPATVNLTVTTVNDGPVASPQSQSLPEDGSLAITLVGSDLDGDALGFSVVTPPTHGALSGTGANLTYTPELNYNGADSFTFVANDGTTNSALATVSLTITPVNDAPVAGNASRTLVEDATTALTLTASDVDGDALTFSIIEMPTHGTLSGAGANITYTPAANYNGPDSFVYRATDPSAANSDALFSLTITPANDLPIGTDQTVGVIEETPLWFVPAASDVDGDIIGFVITQPVHGTAVVTNGGIFYAPATNYFGNDILYYYPTDASSTGALIVVVFNITNVNDRPIANNGTATTAEDTAANITLSGNDADNDTLTFVIVSGPSHGALSGTGANRTYTPAANYNGADSFTFRVEDGTTNSTVATVSITVTPVNDAPTAIGYSGVTAEDTALALTLTASDVESNALSYIIVSNPSHGTLSGSGPAFTYTPGPNYNGPDSFSFKVNDGTVDSATALANVTVQPVNDAPVANAQSVSAAEDVSTPITLTGSDVEGSALTYTVLSSPTHGTLTGTAPNLTYRSATNYNGADSFTFRVNDGSSNSSAATVSINVTAVNDAPIANAQSVTVIYNTAKVITLTGSDLEGSALTYSIVTTPTNGTLSGTAPNVTYTPTVGSAGADRFTFRVNDGGSNSAPATVNITTLNPVAISPAPSSLAVTVPTAQGTLILNWSCTATNEDGFKIERSLNGSSGWSQIATREINIHNYTNTGLANNTRYYYRVRSYNRLGNSSYSNTANNKTRP